MNTPTEPTEAQQDILTPETDIDTRSYEKHIRNARIMLFVLAGLQLLSILLLGEQYEGAKVLIIGTIIVMAVAFTGIGFWTKYQPLPALVTALVLYITLLVITGYFDPSTLYQGIVLKGVVIVLLILGIKNAKDLQDIKKRFL